MLRKIGTSPLVIQLRSCSPVKLIDDKYSEAKEIDKFLINVVHSASIACSDDTEQRKIVDEVFYDSSEKWKKSTSELDKQSIILGFGLNVACSLDLMEIDEKTIDNRPSF